MPKKELPEWFGFKTTEPISLESLAWKISSNWSFQRSVGFHLERAQISEHCYNGFSFVKTLFTSWMMYIFISGFANFHVLHDVVDIYRDPDIGICRECHACLAYLSNIWSRLSQIWIEDLNRKIGRTKKRHITPKMKLEMLPQHFS